MSFIFHVSCFSSRKSEEPPRNTRCRSWGEKGESQRSGVSSALTAEPCFTAENNKDEDLERRCSDTDNGEDGSLKDSRSSITSVSHDFTVGYTGHRPSCRWMHNKVSLHLLLLAANANHRSCELAGLARPKWAKEGKKSRLICLK